jgi:predicted O-methyltransferase YrrM
VKRINFLIRYLKYLCKSQTKHDIHSPFVYSLLTEVFKNKSKNLLYNKVELLRRELLTRNEEITITDLGAGSVVGLTQKRSIKEIAENSSKSPKYGQLLFRLVDRFKPLIMLELGTSLGISSIYQAMANLNGKLITIEGCSEMANIAQQNFKRQNFENIETVVGNFDDELPEVLKNIKQLDYVFFDGNHRKQPTISYFEQCLPLTHDNSLFIFDDIHWSDEMEDAWEQIKNHPNVMVSIDLFFLGLVFFRKEQAKQHFVIRF